MPDEPGAPCRNCGRPTGPRFCGACGQPVDDRRRPLGRLLGELFSDWLSLDSRLARSLAALARPGRLTLLHLDGKRAPYLRPFRLYLLASLVLFSTVLTLQARNAAKVDIYIGGELISKASVGEAEGEIQILGDSSVLTRWLETSWADRYEEFRRLPPQQLLDSLLGSLRRYLPATLILFVPFLAAGLKLLYFKKKTLYLDHLIFALHFQSALFFALAGAWLITRLLGLALLPTMITYAVVCLLMMTIYLGRALGRVYPGRRWGTVARAFLLTFIYMRLLALAVGIAVVAAIWRA